MRYSSQRAEASPTVTRAVTVSLLMRINVGLIVGRSAQHAIHRSDARALHDHDKRREGEGGEPSGRDGRSEEDHCTVVGAFDL